jgi:hypothetical protein
MRPYLPVNNLQLMGWLNMPDAMHTLTIKLPVHAIFLIGYFIRDEMSVSDKFYLSSS